MAIHPTYAHAILEGIKKVEFRKRRVAEDVTTVLIYETAPTQRIVGRFTIEQTVVRRPNQLWRQFGPVGAIGHGAFQSYFAGRDRAVALQVAQPERFPVGVALADLEPQPAIPQSFAYLDAAVLDQIQAHQPDSAVLAAS